MSGVLEGWRRRDWTIPGTPGGWLRAVPAVALLAGCATAVISPEVEEQIGTRMSQEVAEQEGLYLSPSLTAYVEAVGMRLVAAGDPGPYTFRFNIVDQAEPNAFASPGGYVYISRGLLAQVNSEAELAGILAHEISHVTRRHHARAVGRQVGAGLLTLPGQAVGVVSKDLGEMINAPIEVAGQVLLASYSRDQELDADNHGMQLAAAAGYDPTRLAGALEGIERTVAILTGEKHEATFFDSHPTTPTRVQDIARQAKSLKWSPRAPIADRDALYRKLDGLWWGAQNPQQGVFQEQRFLSSDLGITLRFPGGWKTVNTPLFVGASEPEGGAYMALGSGERVPDPGVLTEGLIEKMRVETGLEPAAQRDLALGDWPASIVRYDDNSQAQTVSLYYLFVTSPRETFTLMAMGKSEFRDAMRETALSLRELTGQEARSISATRLRLAGRRAGESLDQFGLRVGNEWPADLTAAINGIATDAAGSGEQSLKILRTERYAP